jgi:hypothetical protein
MAVTGQCKSSVAGSYVLVASPFAAAAEVRPVAPEEAKSRPFKLSAGPLVENKSASR